MLIRKNLTSSSIRDNPVIATAVTYPTDTATNRARHVLRSGTVACHRDDGPSFLNFSNNRALLIRQDLGLDFRYAKPSRAGFGGFAIVTGQHDDADAFCNERLERIQRGFLDWIGKGDYAGQRVVDG